MNQVIMRQGQVFRSSIWNLLGYVLPMAAGLYAFPRLIHGMGPARFGLLTIIWAIIGYFSFLDFGIGRAITYSVSRALGLQEHDRVHSVYWTGSLTLLVVGLALGVLVGFLCPYAVLKFMKIPADLRPEFTTTVKWLGFSLPVLTLTAAPKGVLESYGKFFELSVLRVPFGILAFVVPLWIPSRLQDLSWVTAELVALRIIWLGLYFITVRITCRIRPSRTRFSMDDLRELLHFGGWITVTNFMAPIVNIVDRFFIGSIVSVAAIAFYATPFEIIARALLVPSALATVLFPTLGKHLIDDPLAAKDLYLKSKNALWAIMFASMLVIACLGDRFLGIWVGPLFEEKSRYVVTFISAGIFINGMAYLPYTIMQSAGLPKRVALLHFTEILLFIPLLMFFIRHWGVTGAAIAWFLRALGDFCVLEFMANRKIFSTQFLPAWLRSSLAVGAIIGLSCFPGLWVRAAAMTFIVGALAAYLFTKPAFWRAGPAATV